MIWKKALESIGQEDFFKKSQFFSGSCRKLKKDMLLKRSVALALRSSKVLFPNTF